MQGKLAASDDHREAPVSGPVTIVDIARTCGVSPASVSRVLTGVAGVKEAKRALILETSSRLGYRPNRAARRLVTQKSQLLGFVASDLRNTAYIEYFHTLERAVRKGGYEILIADSERSPEQERKNIERMLDNRVDGLVILPVSDWVGRKGAEHLRHLEQLATPTVLLGQLPDFAFDSISADEKAAASLLVNHLWELGHRSFGFVGFGDPDNRPAKERLEGTAAALEALGCKRKAIRYAEYSDSCWSSVVLDWFTQPHPPTAIVCVNDLLALRLLRPLHAAGIPVPGTVSLCAFGLSSLAGNDIGSLITPSLTVVAFDIPEIAKKAARMLLKRIENPRLALRSALHPARLVVQESTGPPP